MSEKNNSFKVKVEAILQKAKSIANINTALKSLEHRISKLNITGRLNTRKTQKDISTGLKNLKPKIVVDADTSKAEKKLKEAGKQSTDPKLQPTVDNSKLKSGLKEAEKEKESFYKRFSTDTIGSQLIRMAVQSVVQSISQALANIKELNTLKTRIQTTSGISAEDAGTAMQSYNALAKTLSTTTTAVATTADSLLQMGEDISSSGELIKGAQILSKVGMIENADAANYLLASMKGYRIETENAMEIVSKFTAVDEQAAISAGGLAEAVSKCADAAGRSGSSMDRLVGYAAAVGEATNDSMSAVGSSLASMYTRFHDLQSGQKTDSQTGESLADAEKVLNSLGICLTDTSGLYKNFDDILSESSAIWDGLSQAEQNALTTAMSGAGQRQTFTALMENYAKALEYARTAADSSGNAMERYGVYQDSLEAKTNELTAALES